MGRGLRRVGAVVELLIALVLLGVTRLLNGGIRPEYLAVGIATGVLYRHARASACDGGLRGSPVRTVGLTLAWSPIHVVISRSGDGRAGERSFTSGVALGSVAYRLSRRK